mmetsp:Transcript_25047/g.52069  ORF Transcript_25047/g.52069 Transcript_25047/m.52069 type:complete len:231 (-) Transcript_25047:571-1263(-)
MSSTTSSIVSSTFWAVRLGIWAISSTVSSTACSTRSTARSTDLDAASATRPGVALISSTAASAVSSAALATFPGIALMLVSTFLAVVSTFSTTLVGIASISALTLAAVFPGRATISSVVSFTFFLILLATRPGKPTTAWNAFRAVRFKLFTTLSPTLVTGLANRVRDAFPTKPSWLAVTAAVPATTTDPTAGTTMALSPNASDRSVPTNKPVPRAPPTTAPPMAAATAWL